jgi:hypothetical protein
LIEIIGDELDNFASQLVVGKNVLQANKHRNDFVATFQVERDFSDWATIKSALPLIVLPHHEHSLKICD